ncbi:hypothetical protein C2U70_14830 [Bradyrhizobium guangdongense]|uniref:hypothetical protein n=1 Tax=Bradyrhizobium guangdongense TaxID=1325090 RepID=UPI00112B17F7|nr:hypothetical protein [Bradyrhizobium guangdongense]TPQ35328.1 hypothetical protein C2U70_14830 [Bradyrhizobium guangdongense]
MRKTIILGVIAALIGFMAAAQASSDAERAGSNGSELTSTDTDNRGNAIAHEKRERAEHRMRDRSDDDVYGHGKEAREHKHRKHVDHD